MASESLKEKLVIQTVKKPWIFAVDSLHTEGKVHTVNLRENTCTCEGFLYKRTKNCIHLKLVRSLLEENAESDT